MAFTGAERRTAQIVAVIAAVLVLLVVIGHAFG
jgi:hypothetical protein